MIIFKNNKYWWQNCPYDLRKLPEEAGWKWSLGDKMWGTADCEKAFVLQEYMDYNARTIAEKAVWVITDTRMMSRATSSTSIYSAPSGLAYLPFQNAGIDFILNCKNTFLTDQMGLGKTIQAIGAINNLNDIHRVLIVCPASVKIQWRDELNKWLTKFYSISIIKGQGAQKLRRLGEIVIVNYDVLQYYIGQFKKMKFDLKIVDESHYIGNKDAKRTQAVCAIHTKRSLFMGGTPGDVPVKLWPSLNHLAPKIWSDYVRYVLRYCNGYYSERGLESRGASNLDELRHQMRSSIMIRRLRKDVLPDLPRKQKQIILIEAPTSKLQEEENALLTYKFGTNFKQILETMSYDEIVNSLEHSQQSFTTMSLVRKELALSKLPHICEHLISAINSSGKVVCFAYHRELIERICRAFNQSSVVVYGGMSADKKEQAKMKFINDPKCKLYIGQIKTMAGVDGLQKVCSHAVFAELDWNPDNLEQPEDRLERYGQKSSVLIQYLMIDNSLEALIAKKALHKQQNRNQYLDGKESRYELDQRRT